MQIDVNGRLVDKLSLDDEHMMIRAKRSVPGLSSNASSHTDSSPMTWSSKNVWFSFAWCHAS
jgi:hypothetical protein